MSLREEESRRVQIEINKSVIDRVKKENITMDLMGSVLLILVSLFEGKSALLDYTDDSNKERRMLILYKQLERRGLLEPDKLGGDHFKLTARGNELVTYLKQQQEFNVPARELKAEALVSIAETELESCEGWIEDYVNLFPEVPKGVRPIRMHPHTAINRMNAFIKRFKYNKETILAATALYIDEQNHHPDGHKYTSNSNNFISKFAPSHSNYESPLASWCKRWLDEQASGGAQHFNTSVMDMV